MSRFVSGFAAGVAVLVATYPTASGATLSFTESSEQDQLSDSKGTPSPLGLIDMGLNSVEGMIDTADTNTSAQGDHTDSFTFEIPAGMVVQRVEISAGFKTFVQTAGTSGVTADASANGFAATLTNGATLQDSSALVGPFAGSSLLLDGINQYARVQANAFPTSGEFTFECWLKTPTDALGTFREIISQAVAAELPRFYVGIDPDGQIRVGDAWVNTGVTLPMDQWVHLAVVRKTEDTEVYLNGELAGNRGSAIPNPGAAPWMDIGQQFGDNAEFWKGEIDEVRIWNVARTPQQIANQRGSTLPFPAGDLAAHYQFNEAARPRGRFSGDSGAVQPHLFDARTEQFSILLPSGTLTEGTHSIHVESVRPADPVTGIPLGDFQFDYTVNIFGEPLPAPNDDFADATIVSGNTVNVNIANRYSGSEPEEPVHTPNLTGENQRSLWWKWTAPESGTVVIETLPSMGAKEDVVVGDVNYVNVYTGDALSNLNLVAGNLGVCPSTFPNEEPLPCGRDSFTTFIAEAGQTYSIAIHSYTFDNNGFYGNPLLYNPREFYFYRDLTSWSLRYLNDRPEDAFLLGGSDFTVAFDTLGSRLTEMHEAHPNSMQAWDSIWWKWTAPSDGRVSLSGITPNTREGQGFILELYRGTPGNLQKIATDESEPILNRPPGANVRAGEQYFVSFSNASVPGNGACYNPDIPSQEVITLGVQLEPPPNNDDFSNRTLIRLGQRFLQGSNWGAGSEPGEPSSHVDAAGNTAWWEWRATRTGPATITTQGSDFNTMLAVYQKVNPGEPASLSNLELLTVGGEDDNLRYIRQASPETFRYSSRVRFDAVQGESYYLLVDGLRSANPVNDLVAGSIQLHFPVIALDDLDFALLSSVSYDGPDECLVNPFRDATRLEGTVTVQNQGDSQSSDLRLRLVAQAGYIKWNTWACSFTTENLTNLTTISLPGILPPDSQVPVNFNTQSPFPEILPAEGCDFQPDGDSIKYWLVMALLEMRSPVGSNDWYLTDSLPIWHSGTQGYYRPDIGPFGGVIRPDSEFTSGYVEQNQFRIAAGQTVEFELGTALGLSPSGVLIIEQEPALGTLNVSNQTLVYESSSGTEGWTGFVVKVQDVENGINDTVRVWLELANIIAPKVNVRSVDGMLELDTLVEAGLQNTLQSTSDFRAWYDVPEVNWTPGTPQTISRPLDTNPGETFYRIKVEP